MLYKKFEIPAIYEEDVIELIFKGCNVTFKYYNGDNIVEIEFQYVYKYDYCDFECVSDTDYEFGLMQYYNSDLLKQFLATIEKDRLKCLFCGEYNKLKHFKLVADDVGIYNFICKGINIKL
jgi:hypothetical protein